MDKNVLCHFMYLCISLKINDYFYKKTIKVFLSKFNEILDFRNLVFKRSFNQMTIIIMIK